MLAQKDASNSLRIHQVWVGSGLMCGPAGVTQSPITTARIDRALGSASGVSGGLLRGLFGGRRSRVSSRKVGSEGRPETAAQVRDLHEASHGGPDSGGEAD